MSQDSRTIRKFIRQFQSETGQEEYRMSDAVAWAVRKGFPVPLPISGEERLAKRFSRAAAEETRYDKKARETYRANHARIVNENGKQIPIWFDIDRVSRKVVEKYSTQRREQIFDQIFAHTTDMSHWNRTHSDEAPIQFELDFTDDMAWRKNAPDEEKKAS